MVFDERAALTTRLEQLNLNEISIIEQIRLEKIEIYKRLSEIEKLEIKSTSENPDWYIKRSRKSIYPLLILKV